MTFGEKLRQLREQSGLTQEQLAQKIYVTRTAISKWETDRGYPGIDSLKQLSGIFVVNIDYLMSPDNGEGAKNEDKGQTAIKKRTRLFYIICAAFLAAAFLFALPAGLLQMPYLFIASIAATILFAVFALLATPPSTRIKNRQTLISYALSRVVIVAVISLAVITTLIKLFV